MADKTKKINSNVLEQWHVQDENGGVFGPVDFNTLQEWVEDGRVSPLSKVSSDEQNSWTPAVSIADLEMNCVAEIEPGSFYGPIHQSAMAGLVNDGSIPANAILYRRNDAVDAASADLITPAELQLALDKAAVFEFEKKGLEEKIREQDSDFEMLQKQIASLCTERDEILVANREIKDADKKLEADVADLKKELEKAVVERDAASKKIELLQNDKAASEKSAADAEKKLAASAKKIGELEEGVGKIKAEYQVQIDSLTEQNQDLKSQGARVKDEAEGLRSEVDTLRKNLHEQQRLMDDREKLHGAELKDKEKACTLRIDNMVLEHETAVNSIRQEALEDNRSLQDEVGTLQDDVKKLQKQNKLIVSEKEAITEKIKELDRKSERSDNASNGELKVKNIRIEELSSENKRLVSEIKSIEKAKERRIDELASEMEGLLSEIEELRKTNEQLKSDFVTFEEQKAGAESDRTAERKLIVLKQLFVEAAGLLQDVEDDVAGASAEESGSESSEGTDEPELLDFEEVEPHESPVQKNSSKKKASLANHTEERSVNVAKSAPAPEPEKKTRPKKSKKWPFGSGKKNLDHRSLAELEAQARVELQRLSSNGGDISALFDKNK